MYTFKDALELPFRLLFHLTLGALVCWAWGPDEGGGWHNWLDELKQLLKVDVNDNQK